LVSHIQASTYMGQMLLIYIWIIMNRDPAGRQYLVKCHSLVTRETRPSCFIPHLAIDQDSLLHQSIAVVTRLRLRVTTHTRLQSEHGYNHITRQQRMSQPFRRPNEIVEMILSNIQPSLAPNTTV
jgi:hypothetical protein